MNEFYLIKFSQIMKKYFAILVLSACISCNQSQEKAKIFIDETLVSSEGNSLISPSENTIKSRFLPPVNFVVENAKSNSFGEFLQNFPLKKYGTEILRFDGNPISTQTLHEAVFDIDTDEKDLQQCADSVMRLYAEFLWKQNRKNEIAFHFTSGDLVKWMDYRDGNRPIIDGNSVSFRKTANFDDSYKNFRNYLDLIYNYAGTISLSRETKPVLESKNLKIGDILITPGSPGHVVFIAGVCKNKEGKKLFLLAEGFTPAQSIHVLKNPYHKEISPWYELDVNATQINTARFTFSPVNFRSLD